MELKDHISFKSINLLCGEDGIIPKSLAVIPFPSQKLKGLIKTLEIKDTARRGGAIDSSIAVIFKETHDLIFYKNIDSFEILFNATAHKIVQLVESGAPRQQIEAELRDFQGSIIDMIVTCLERKEKSKEIKRSLLLLFNLVQKDLNKAVNELLLGSPVIVIGDKALVELIIDTLTIFYTEKTPTTVYWTEVHTSGDIIGGPPFLTEVFKTNVIVDLTKGRVIGGKSNVFCKKLLKNTRQLDSSHAEQHVTHKLKKFHSKINTLLSITSKKEISPTELDEFIADLDPDELDLIEIYLMSKHPEKSEELTKTTSVCRKKMSKILSGFEKQKW